MTDITHPRISIKSNYLIAFFIAWASVLQMLEYLFPNPFPGVRLGLANMVTLVVLVQLGFSTALEVAVLRVLISSLLLGSFLAPGFMLSLCAAIGSTLIMGIVYQSLIRYNPLKMSLMTISQFGALSHNLIQLSLVYLLLIHHPGIFLLTPWLMLSGVIMGILTGIIAINLNKRFDSEENLSFSDIEYNLDILRQAQPSDKQKKDYKIWGLNINPGIKFLLTLAFSFIIIYFPSIKFYSVALAFCLVLTLGYRLSVKKISADVRKMLVFIVLAFLVPTLFTGQGNTILNLYFLKLTSTGVRAGVIFAGRIILLLIISSIFMRTSNIRNFGKIIKRALSPLECLGISINRWAELISLSWLLIPDYMNITFSYFKKNIVRDKNFTNLINVLTCLIFSTLNKKNSTILPDEIKEPGQEKGT
ncbi:MAG: Gx transporter family protein [Candidatus Margulisbacteria bacterium]|nr:Gx transporter family protein [Candidatus Margulisiibacteriota bacterium]